MSLCILSFLDAKACDIILWSDVPILDTINHLIYITGGRGEELIYQNPVSNLIETFCSSFLCKGKTFKKWQSHIAGLLLLFLCHINSYGHITARRRLGTYSVFGDRMYDMIGKTCHWDPYPTLFEEWQGIFYVQCPIARAPHTMAIDYSIMGTVRGRPSDGQGSTGTRPHNLLTAR